MANDKQHNKAVASPPCQLVVAAARSSLARRHNNNRRINDTQGLKTWENKADEVHVEEVFSV